MLFSDLMRACGLNPNSDTGTFSYHLSILLDSDIVVKKDNEYQLTDFGNKTSSTRYNGRVPFFSKAWN